MLSFVCAHSFINVISFNIPSASCYSTEKVDYVTTLVMTTMLPILVSLFIFVLYACEWLYFRVTSRSNKSPQEIVDVEQGLVSRYLFLFLLLTYMVLPSVSSVIAQAYSCTDIDPSDVAPGEDYYLRFDGITTQLQMWDADVLYCDSKCLLLVRTVCLLFTLRLCSVDLSISCSSARYEFGVLWATAMLFVYPIGIPVRTN